MLDYVTTHEDTGGIFSRWQIDGADRSNTDHGRAWVSISEDTGDFTVSVFSDAGRNELVSEGTLNGANTGDVTLSEQNGSGMSGSVRLRNASPVQAVIDIFYADDDDLTSLQAEIANFLDAGEFAGKDGFSDPRARAKRVVDALINARFPQGWFADSLQPLAEATARYALFFIYDFLSTRADDASQLARHWRREARAALPRIRLSVSAQLTAPFAATIERA